MKVFSIRRRLTVVLVVGFVLLVAGTSVALSAALGKHVTAELDTALLAEAQAFVALTEQEDGQVELDFDEAAMPQYQRDESPAYFQLWRDDGRMLLASRHLTADLPRPDAIPAGGVAQDVTLPDGRPGRMVALSFVPRISVGDDDDDDASEGGVAKAPTPMEASLGHRVTVLVARDRIRLDSLLTRMGWTIALIGVLASLGGLLFVWRALAAGFRPVDQIASQVSALDAESLQARITLEPVPQELGPVVAQVNGLLARLDNAFERERRFTGNVAHELRTPIAELRSLAAVGARWPEDTDAVAGYFQDVGAVATRMDGMIADLLLLARCQAGVEHLAHGQVDVAALIATTWLDHAVAAEARGLRLSTNVPAGLVVESDERKLGILLTNLLGNAVSYAKPGSMVTCLAEGVPGTGRFVLEVLNVADALQPEDLERLAEPFWRKDAARAPSDHAGLGLALVSALSDLLRLDITFSQDGSGIFRARIEGDAALAPAARSRESRRADLDPHVA